MLRRPLLLTVLIFCRVEPSSFGWHPKNKKQELFHRESRFLLLYWQKPDADDGETPIVAFTMFRFEPGYMDEDSVYMYALHLRFIIFFIVMLITLLSK